MCTLEFGLKILNLFRFRLDFLICTQKFRSKFYNEFGSIVEVTCDFVLQSVFVCMYVCMCVCVFKLR